MSEDFHESFKDPNVFFGMEEIWEVVDNTVFSIRNMDEHELRQAIVQDILSVNMWEKHYGQTVHFGLSKLMRFIPRQQFKRVWAALKHEEIYPLLEIKRTDTDSEIRIRDERAILQSAMDYCGVWYSGYEMPKNGVLVLNPDSFERIEAAYGNLENLAASIAMDVRAELANSPTGYENRTISQAVQIQSVKTYRKTHH